MAAFLRKKSKNDTPKSQPPPQPPVVSAPPTPLFSRFATSHSSQHDTHSRVVVSGPMTLAPARKDSASIHSSRNAPPVDPHQRRRTTNPQPPPSAFNNDHTRPAEGPPGVYQPQPQPQPVPGQKYGRYSLPAQQSLTPASRDKPLPSGDHYARTQPPGSMRAPPQPVQPNLKPLPNPVPQAHPPPQTTPAYQSPPPSNRASYQLPQNLPFDTQGRHSPLIDLPPEIALFQEFGEGLLSTPPDSINSKQQQQHQATGISPSSPPPPIVSSSPPFSSNAQFPPPTPQPQPLTNRHPTSPPPFNNANDYYNNTNTNNNMGMNSGPRHGPPPGDYHQPSSSSSPLPPFNNKDFRVSLRSSPHQHQHQQQQNTTTTTATNALEKRKRVSASFSPPQPPPIPQTPPPPKKASGQTAAVAARITPPHSSPPISVNAVTHNNKVPSKRQKALPQVPPAPALPSPPSLPSSPNGNVNMNNVNHSHSMNVVVQPSPPSPPHTFNGSSPPHHTSSPVVRQQQQLQPSPAIVSSSSLAQTMMGGQPPPRIFAANNGVNNNPDMNHYHQSARSRESFSPSPQQQQQQQASPDFRFSQIPEIPPEFEVVATTTGGGGGGYPSPPLTDMMNRRSSVQYQDPAVLQGHINRNSNSHTSRPLSALSSTTTTTTTTTTSSRSRTIPAAAVVTQQQQLPLSSFSPPLPPPTPQSPPRSRPLPAPVPSNHQASSPASSSSPSATTTSPSSAASPALPPLLSSPPPPVASSSSQATRRLSTRNHSPTPEEEETVTATAPMDTATTTMLIPPHYQHVNGNMNGAAHSDGENFEGKRPLTPLSPPNNGKFDPPVFELTATPSLVIDLGGGSGKLFDEGEDALFSPSSSKIDGTAAAAGEVIVDSEVPTSVSKEEEGHHHHKDKPEKKKKEKETEKEREKREKEERREERRERRREKERRREERAKEKEKEAKRSSLSADVVVPSDLPHPADDNGVNGHEGVEGEEEEGDVQPQPQAMTTTTTTALPPASPHVAVAIAKAIAAAASREKPRADKLGPFTLLDFISDPEFLMMLLEYLSFYDWCVLASVSREVRIVMVQRKEVREEILERFLKTVGYQRWSWVEELEPLSLSLQDLSDYMRGVSTPTHEYARTAGLYVQSLSIHPNLRDPGVLDTIRALTASARAYTRVVLRLRAQAEKELAVYTANQRKNNNNHNGSTSPYRSGGGGVTSRGSSRAPSPSYSSFSQSQHHLPSSSSGQNSPRLPHQQQPNSTTTHGGVTFRSPLFSLRRAPLLRVFVPSPEGDWLSDKSVLECEAECRRAGVTKLLRMGDVVWDIAVGDEGNVGRLVWDGSYLIDLDYTFSPMGELPKYMPSLAFPPSYFHRVVRTGPTAGNPIIHVDVSPWGEEIAANLQLLQDRVRTETPQGAYHNVVRWVNRSSFVIRPPSRRSSMKTPPPANGANKASVAAAAGGKIPIPGSDHLFVDAGWYGTIVVETEGTTESLADLQDRCGPGAFPPRARGMHKAVTQAQVENRKVFRILREKSRPGEIWIKCVSVRERML